MTKIITIAIGCIAMALCTTVQLNAQAVKKAYGNGGTGTFKSAGPGNRSGSSTYLRKGFKGSVEIFGGYECFEWGFDVGVTASCGYQFNPYFYLGGMIGTGFPATFLIGADSRVYFTKTKTAPFLALQAGYGIGEYYDFGSGPEGHSGFYVSVGPGVRFWLRENMGISLKPSFKFMAGAYNLCMFSLDLGFDF